MKRKKLIKLLSVFGLVLALVFPTLVACSSDNTETPITPYPISNFVNYVTRIQTPITLDSEADIEAGLIIYDHLSETYKNNKDVKSKKQELDEYKATFDVLKAEQDALDAAALKESQRKRFERAVSNLPQLDKLSVNDRTAITAAYELYEILDAESRKVQSVIGAYLTLQDADGVVAALEEEKRIQEIHDKAQKFVDGVESLVEEEISLESERDIEDLLYDYENLPDEAKEFEEVVAAKVKLDEAYSEYKELKDESDVEEFLKMIEDLPDTEDITLDDRKSIVDAETLYEYMSDEAKTADDVPEAHDKLVAAREKYDELYEADQLIRIQLFIEAVNAIPTDTSNVDMSWFDVLDNASSRYKDLSVASQKNPDVEEAYNRWNAVQTVFDKKGYKRVSTSTLSFWIAADGNFVVGDPDAVNSYKTSLCTLYELSNAGELDSVTDIIVKVYDNGNYIDSFKLELSDISAGPGHIILCANITNGLRTISDSLVHNTAYSFSYYIADETGEYINSPETNIVATTYVYSW